MNYDNPEINFIISTPGRTGSTLIWDVLTYISKKALYRRDHTENILPMKAKECLHSHDPLDVKLGNSNTIYILSKRNLIDSALSSAIVLKTGKFIYYKNRPVKIDPFILDPEIFLGFYNSKKKFYEDISVLLPKNALIIDYKIFEDDIKNLFDFLQISTKYLEHYEQARIPRKTAGNYNDWIINFNEISEIASKLDPNPCI